MGKNGCRYSGHRTLKLTVSQKGINGIFVVLCKLREVKRHDLLGLETLKPGVSQEGINGIN